MSLRPCLCPRLLPPRGRWWRHQSMDNMPAERIRQSQHPGLAARLGTVFPGPTPRLSGCPFARFTPPTCTVSLVCDRSAVGCLLPAGWAAPAGQPPTPQVTYRPAARPRLAGRATGQGPSLLDRTPAPRAHTTAQGRHHPTAGDVYYTPTTSGLGSSPSIDERNSGSRLDRPGPCDREPDDSSQFRRLWDAAIWGRHPPCTSIFPQCQLRDQQ